MIPRSTHIISKIKSKFGTLIICTIRNADDALETNECNLLVQISRIAV
jgi:hypothetical protein